MQISTCDLMSLTKLTPSNCTEMQNVKSLRNVLKNHLSTLKLTAEALRLFLEGNMPDPLVGENACQIRTAIYTHLAQDPKAMQQLAGVAEKVEALIERLSLLEVKRGASLVELLQENEADLQVPSMVCPIVLGHILTISKESALTIKKNGGLPSVSLIEGNKPQKMGGISASVAKVLIKNARQALSEMSIQYLRDEASSLAIEGPCNVITDQNRLHTTPLLPGMKILLESMNARGTPILLKNRIIDPEGSERGVVTLLSRGGERGFQDMQEPLPEDRDCAAMIIEAVSISSKMRTPQELKKEMIAEGLERIILANSAAHPQYGGVSKEIEPPQTEEREALKAVALEKGLCEKNPDLCQIYHIFAGRIGAHVQGGAL